VLHYAGQLEAYTSREPLPWTDMLITRARLLADVGANGMSKQARTSLEALKTECQRMSGNTALVAVERALSG
jgi:hypothetical protein